MFRSQFLNLSLLFSHIYFFYDVIIVCKYIYDDVEHPEGNICYVRRNQFGYYYIYRTHKIHFNSMKRNNLAPAIWFWVDKVTNCGWNGRWDTSTMKVLTIMRQSRLYGKRKYTIEFSDNNWVRWLLSGWVNGYVDYFCYNLFFDFLVNCAAAGAVAHLTTHSQTKWLGA